MSSVRGLTLSNVTTRGNVESHFAEGQGITLGKGGGFADRQGPNTRQSLCLLSSVGLLALGKTCTLCQVSKLVVRVSAINTFFLLCGSHDNQQTLCQACFTEYSTRQTICRVPWALGKSRVSSSDLFVIIF